MQVPLLLTRQVFVKLIPASTLVLSGIVTSITKDALFVQSGIFVGRGVSAVGVNCADVASAVSVFVTKGVSVFDVGDSISVGVCVSEEGVTAGPAVACGLQPESINVINKGTMNSLLIILTSFCVSCLISLLIDLNLIISLSEHHHLCFGFFKRITGNLLLKRFTR